jgi:hypothetical protein
MNEPEPMGRDVLREQPPLQSRLTVRGTIYFQQPGAQPTSVPYGYSRLLDSDEQPYGPRRVKVGGQWQPLDAGWVRGAGLFSLENRPDGKGGAVAIGLSLGHAGDEAEHVVTLVPEVRPGEAAGWRPADLGALRVRCLRGETVCLLTVFPA